MAEKLGDLLPPRPLPSVTTNELRDNLSQVINRAGFGTEPVLVTRRGRKVAAIISVVDLTFLLTMRKRRDEVISEELPKDESQAGSAIAQSLRWELFFG